ncbi:MAG: hypothetical protein AYK19_09085 [Theionarchaea archaeon DG-70-1]|nr:MAG: hypothetical protein AYK19_09085 [Theionarchaea archaeon DG-70-1]
MLKEGSVSVEYPLIFVKPMWELILCIISYSGPVTFSVQSTILAELSNGHSCNNLDTIRTIKRVAEL